MSKGKARHYERKHLGLPDTRSPRLTILTADLEKIRAVADDLQRQIDEEKSRLTAEAQSLIESSGAAADRRDSEPT